MYNAFCKRKCENYIRLIIFSFTMFFTHNFIEKVIFLPHVVTTIVRG